MTALIQRVSDMIGDPTNVAVSTQQVQDKLDWHRFQTRYALLRAEPTLAGGGILNYTDYYANVGNWETGEILVNGGYNVITPATSDELVGRWIFALPPPGQYPPVMITGAYYDVHAAACDCLRLRIAQLATTAIAFTADGRTFHLEQQITTFQALIAEYQRKQLARSVPLIRTDLSDGDAIGIPAFGVNSVGDW